MTQNLINRAFYDAICNFQDSDEAQDLYYRVMDTPTGRKNSKGMEETVRDQILRAYAMLFCEDIGLEAGMLAGPDDVEATADRLYIGEMGFDPEHWYRMQHHFPVIDEDNYDRFAALVISDLNAGSLHDAAKQGGEMLLVGAPNPLIMSPEERRAQSLRRVKVPESEDESV